MQAIAKFVRGTGIFVGLFFGIPSVWLMATEQITFTAWVQVISGLAVYAVLCYCLSALMRQD